jgi:AraC-like DNA-binding protein
MIEYYQQFVNILPLVGKPKDYNAGVEDAPFRTLPKNVMLFHNSRADLDTSVISFHHRFVLIIAASGASTVVIDGQYRDLLPGHACIIMPFQRHYYARLDDGELHWLFITFEHDDFATFDALRDRVLPIPPVAWAWIAGMTETFLATREGHTEDVGRIAVGLSVFLDQLLRVKAPAETSTPVTTAEQDWRRHLVGRVCLYVQQHVQERMTAAALAEQFDISESHLRAVFRQTVGISLGRFIRETKISKACWHLRNSSHTVSEIALLSGYDSLYAFSRTFRTVMTMSPSIYRRIAIGNSALPNYPRIFRED